MVLEAIQALFPQLVVDSIASLSFLTHFEAISKGVLDMRDLLFFIGFIGAWLVATATVIEMKKAD